MMKTANMSGYSANIPGAFMDMYSLQKFSMCFPINSSNVALHARATLEVPEMKRTQLTHISCPLLLHSPSHPFTCKNELHPVHQLKLDKAKQHNGKGSVVSCLPMI